MKLSEFSKVWHSSNLYSLKGAQVSSTIAISRLFKKALESKKGGRVLEIGSGRGGALEMLKEYTESSPIATDINPIFVDNIRKKGYEAYIVNAEDSLPFNDLEFDVIYSDQVLEHLTNPAKVLDDIRRILKNDGFLLLGVPDTSFHDETAYFNSVHYNYYTKKTLMYTLRSIGFTVDFVSNIESRRNFIRKYLYRITGKSASGGIYAQARKDLTSLDVKITSLTPQAEISELKSLFK